MHIPLDGYCTRYEVFFLLRLEELTIEQAIETAEEMASIGLKILLVVHPYNHVINSVIVAVVVETPRGFRP